jgi:hypothetical protein
MTVSSSTPGTMSRWKSDFIVGRISVAVLELAPGRPGRNGCWAMKKERGRATWVNGDSGIRFTPGRENAARKFAESVCRGTGTVGGSGERRMSAA